MTTNSFPTSVHSSVLCNAADSTTTHLLRLLVQNLLHSRPRNQFLIPLIALRVRALPLLLKFRMNETQHAIPRDKHEISIRYLVTDKVLFPGLCEMSVDHTLHALDFVSVTFDGRGDAFVGVELARAY